ncbi:MAG: DEAD/DEAH box helicase [Phycisphaerales bacterium]
MELKTYQQRVVDEVETYLSRVQELRAEGESRFASMAAWQDLNLGNYTHEKNGLDEDLPHFTIKVPTGGGKTLIATQILGLIHQSILRDRNGAGLVLWVVPSQQIYRDTLKRLSDREDIYRIFLEHALSRRIELWEKGDIARLTPAKLRENLNILILQLASTNRETKDQLKFFRDSGGNIVQHFPPEDDPEKHREWKEETPNLDMIENDADTGRHLITTSVGNLVRLCKPAVILDEGHKATSDLARRTIKGFNASIVVELSATPPSDANIISRVSGDELLDEEMIKLPLNIATSGNKSWEDALTQARDKRKALHGKANELAAAENAKQIRPIVLVQVERTGKEQRGTKVKGRRVIHADDVRDYLMQRLSIPETAIAVKSSSKDDIEDVDLMDPDCPIQWIITKSALQEGWDCPFAYILCSLNNTGSGQAMTQLVGRILRQPFQERTPDDALNESYVYCLHKGAREIAREVKKALEKEGYEGNIESMIAADGERSKPQTKSSRVRAQFSDLYSKPFEGKIYLPHFCVKSGSKYEPLDYFRHLISAVDVDTFDFQAANGWHLADELEKAKDRFYRMTLGEAISREYETDVDLEESDEQIKAWLTASLPFDYLSFKQLRRVVHGVCDVLIASELDLGGRLGLVKFVVRDHLVKLIQEQLDQQTEAAFAALYESGRLEFFLECKECRFQIPESVNVKVTRPFTRDDGNVSERSLFDYVDDSGFNEYEREVAICLDKDERVLWWYRNLVGRENFAIQGYRRNKVYPDFVVQDNSEGRTNHRVIVVETKGAHLQGEDTAYKKNIAEYFERVGRNVTWQQLGEGFKDHIFRFQVVDQIGEGGRDWRDAWEDIIQDDTSPSA